MTPTLSDICGAIVAIVGMPALIWLTAIALGISS